MGSKEVRSKHYSSRFVPSQLLVPSLTLVGPNAFELEVSVSGYAISYKSPENASRSQRAFIRLAKGKS